MPERRSVYVLLRAAAYLGCSDVIVRAWYLSFTGQALYRDPLDGELVITAYDYGPEWWDSSGHLYLRVDRRQASESALGGGSGAVPTPSFPAL